MFFSGTPLLPDPQNPAFYLPNIIFLFTDTDTGFIISVFLHALVSGAGIYLLGRNFNFTKSVSLICAFLYIASPRLASYLEAGHYGLVTAWAWFPWVMIATMKIKDKLSLRWAVALAFFLSLIYFSHILTFAILVAANGLFFFFYGKLSVKKLILFGFSHLLLAAAVSPILIAQVNWQRETTRDLLLSVPDTYPVWNGKLEFIKNLFLASRDTEKNIIIGLPVLFLSLIGLSKVRRGIKVIIITAGIIITLVTLNNVSPVYGILSHQNWFLLLRVATRFWFVIIIPTILLTGYSLLSGGRVLKAIAVLAIIESVAASMFILSKAVPVPNALPDEAYEFLESDSGTYRVFCLDLCIPQKQAAIYNLELVEGYGTLQQKNYYRQSQQLAQAFYRNRYTLAIPPFEIYLYENLQPVAAELAKFRVKYVLSKNALRDENLKPIRRFGQHIMYQNLLYTDPDYLIYTPNRIRVKTEGKNLIVIPEVYSKGWRAYADGAREIPVFETKDARREVRPSQNTNFVDFIYN